MNNLPSPEVLALLVCDQIITDRLTGKQSLIGMFSAIHAVRFPVTHPQLAVFASMTGGHSRVPLTIRMVDANEARPPLVQGQGQVEFQNPLAVANLALQFHGLTFPEPGEYRVQLLCRDELLREARLRLMLARTRPKKSGADDSPSSSDPPPDQPPDSGEPQ